MAPRETENNAYAKFWGDKQRTLWYVMVFLEWSIVLGGSGLRVKRSNRSAMLPPESKGLCCLVSRYYPLIAYSSGKASRKCLRRQQVNPHNDTSHVATNQQPVFCARDS